MGCNFFGAYKLFLMGCCLLFLSCEKSKKFEQYNKTAFFITEETLVVIDPSSVYLYDWETAKKGKTLYSAPQGSQIELQPLNSFDSTDRVSQYVALFEKTKNNYTLVLYSFDKDKIFKFPLQSKPSSMHFIAKDLIELNWPQKQLKITLNPVTQNFTEEKLPSLNTQKTKTKNHLSVLGQTKKAEIQGSYLVISNVQNDVGGWNKKFHSEKKGVLAFGFSPNESKLVIGGNWYGQLGSLFIYETDDEGHLLARVLGANDK